MLRLSVLAGFATVSAGLVLLSLIVTSIVTRTPAEIQGVSMEPTLHSGDQVVVRHDPSGLRRGDVVVLVGVDGYEGPATKRLVALAGDRVKLLGDRVLVNGRLETTRSLFAREGVGRGAEFVVPEGHVFVLGDNRPVSLDSRMLGPLPTATVQGVVDYVTGPGPAHPLAPR